MYEMMSVHRISTLPGIFDTIDSFVSSTKECY